MTPRRRICKPNDLSSATADGELVAITTSEQPIQHFRARFDQSGVAAPSSVVYLFASVPRHIGAALGGTAARNPEEALSRVRHSRNCRVPPTAGTGTMYVSHPFSLPRCHRNLRLCRWCFVQGCWAFPTVLILPSPARGHQGDSPALDRVFVKKLSDRPYKPRAARPVPGNIGPGPEQASRPAKMPGSHVHGQASRRKKTGWPEPVYSSPRRVLLSVFGSRNRPVKARAIPFIAPLGDCQKEAPACWRGEEVR